MNSAGGKIRRSKTSGPLVPKAAPAKQSVQDMLEEALQARDFSKATAILEFLKEHQINANDLPVAPWLGYAAFHLGDYQQSIDVYKELLLHDEADSAYWLYLACAYLANGQFKEAGEAAAHGPPTALQNRILLHVAYKLGDESKLMAHHSNLRETVEDQLSAAALHFNRHHHQEASEIYKKILVDSREFLALNVYVAMCYYKLDYYEPSLEILNVYLQAHPDSATGINLRASNHCKLYHGKSAEQELKVLINLQSTAYNLENTLVEHNLVVFRGGENALQVLPPLMESMHEARLNLVTYHLKNDQFSEANELLTNVEPVVPTEFILKAVTCAQFGQQIDSQEYVHMAQQYFQMIGNAPTERDTIPGRQCMASSFFLLRSFPDVVKYLRSIRSYYAADDTFLYQYGIALSQTGEWAEAEEILLSVKSDKIKAEYSYIAALVRSHIMAKHAKKAWDIYLKMDTSNESFNVVQLIANDCYRVGSFFYAAKAFDVLERLDGAMEYWQGKRGACVGVFQQVIAGREPSDSLLDAMKLLDASVQLHQAEKPQLANEAEQIQKVMRNWAKDHGLKRK